MNRTVIWAVGCVLLVLLPAVHAAPVAPTNDVDEVAPTNVSEDVESPVDAVTPSDERAEAYDSVELMMQVIMHIRNSYVSEKSYEEIAYGALHGMLHSLDPHSDFLEPRAYKGLKADTQGSFGGIGIQIGIRQGVLTVIAPIEGTPGFEAGLQAGDRITRIEGETTLGVSLRDAVDKLRGPIGTEVTITVQSSTEEKPQDYTITRASIEVSSIKGARILDHDIGYVRITQFGHPTAKLLQEALNELHAQGMKALVLDLRNNPGGLLDSAVAVAQKFVPSGEVIVTTRGRGGKDDETVRRGDGSFHYTDYPMAVLVNQGSASASEIVAGCLQDYGRAVLIGERTFGKGSVQSVIRMNGDDEAAIRLTTAHYYTPNGRLIHEKGIDPDIEVLMDPVEWRRVLVRRLHMETPTIYSDEEIAQYADAVDTQLQRAVDLLQGVLIFANGAE